MVSNRWLKGRKAHWERLESLLRRANAGLNRLTGAELQELGLLYRQTASDLSTVLEDRSSAQLAAYLNQLLGKSHNLLYMGQRPTRAGILTFYRDVYPRVFRQTLPLTALATAIFLAAALAGWMVTAHDPGFAHRLLGPQMMESIEHRKMWTESVVAIKPVASSFITTNNLSVAFVIFALGITGVGTAWMMMFNGLLLGVVGEATWRAGMALSLVEFRCAAWSFGVAGHLHCRRRGFPDCTRAAVSGTVVEARIAGARRRASSAVAARHDSPAAGSGNHRGVLFAHESSGRDEVFIGGSAVRGAAGLSVCGRSGGAYSGFLTIEVTLNLIFGGGELLPVLLASREQILKPLTAALALTP